MVDLCEATGKPFRTVPPTKDLVAGRVAAGQLRQVSIEDLLGRDPVSLDWEAIRPMRHQPHRFDKRLRHQNPVEPILVVCEQILDRHNRRRAGAEQS